MHLEERIQAVVAILECEGRFLLVERSDYNQTASGYWCPVSGRVEVGESKWESRKRGQSGARWKRK